MAGKTDMVVGTYQVRPKVEVTNSDVVLVGYGINAVGVVYTDGAVGAFRISTIIFAYLGFTAATLVLASSVVVLRTKLPAFPMRNWLALYVVLGAIFGSVSAIAEISPWEAEERLLGGSRVALDLESEVSSALNPGATKSTP